MPERESGSQAGKAEPLPDPSKRFYSARLDDDFLEHFAVRRPVEADSSLHIFKRFPTTAARVLSRRRDASIAENGGPLLLAGIVDFHRLHFALTAVLVELKVVMVLIADL
jgi:hypothetical protein